MFSIVYVSSAIQPFTQEELADLLQSSRKNNVALGVTGMLLYKDGSFMQVLEGEQAAVQQTFNKISRDPRHRGVVVLLKQTLAARDFDDWSMGFRNLNSPEIRELEGYSEFLNVGLNDQMFLDEPAKSQKLLLTFRRTMR
jgi:Sensors of blue-light using FAD